MIPGSSSLSRREFIIATSALAGGMALAILQRDATAAAPTDAELTPWIVIGADDSITVRVAAPEAGTGITTQVAMYVAEELECAWEKIRLEPISYARNAREGNLYLAASGVWSTFAGGGCQPEVMQTMMQAGASARERLRAAAAARWKVPGKEIDVRAGELIHQRSSRRARFGEVAADAAALKLSAEPALKPREKWTLLGKRSPTLMHVKSVVDGSSVYGMDIRLPGMLYAALLQCPVHGGRLKTFDFEAIKKMSGVRGFAVVDPDEPRRIVVRPAPWAITDAQSGIAVVADHYWQARKALDALPITWDHGAGAQWKTTQQIYDAVVARLDKPADDLVLDRGDAPRLIEEAGEKAVEANYLTPFSDHATMEPLNGTAMVTQDGVELWHPTAMVLQALAITTEETGVPAERIKVHLPLVGGSFGRRVGCDDLRMVLAVAKKFPGTPVHVIWSREETFRQGKYRDLQAARMRAALGADGLPAAWLVQVAGRKSLLLGLDNGAYANGCIPHVRIEKSDVDLHILTGQYRGPGYNSQCFFMESFIDECAARAGIDPLEYRLRIFSKWRDSGWTGCLNEVRARSGWGEKLPAGQGRGVAIGNFGMEGRPETGTTVAVVAMVEVDKEGALVIHAIDLAFDCGRTVNLTAVRAQLEGSVVFGLNMCLNEEITIENGRVVEGNFDRYPMLRMIEMPRVVNIHTGALSGHERHAGVGEAAVGVIGPAVANAVFAATGIRMRTMPFRKHDLKPKGLS